jgi:ferredoxin
MGSPIPFSCRSANCGTCRVDVLEGGSGLEDAREDEREVLALLGDDAHERRLACQARVRSATDCAVIRIRRIASPSGGG